jgi:hypothetical protein
MPRAALDAVPSARVLPISAIAGLSAKLPIASPTPRTGADWFDAGREDRAY